MKKIVFVVNETLLYDFPDVDKEKDTLYILKPTDEFWSWETYEWPDGFEFMVCDSVMGRFCNMQGKVTRMQQETIYDEPEGVRARLVIQEWNPTEIQIIGDLHIPETLPDVLSIVKKNPFTPTGCMDYSFLDWPEQSMHILNEIWTPEWKIEETYTLAHLIARAKVVDVCFFQGLSVQECISILRPCSIFKGVSKNNRIASNLFYRDASIQEDEDGEYLGEAPPLDYYFVVDPDDDSTREVLDFYKEWRHPYSGKYHVPVVKSILFWDSKMEFASIELKKCKSGFYTSNDIEDSPMQRWEKYSDPADLPVTFRIAYEEED